MPRDLQNDAVGSSRITDKVNSRAGPFRSHAELIQILIQIGCDRGLRLFHSHSQRRKIDLVCRVIACRTPALLECSQVGWQARIFERATKTYVKSVGMVDRV